MMKRATCIIIAALICSSALFAWIGDVSLTNVKFNGTIENVGESEDGKHSDVTISVTKETAQGSVYTIGKADSGGECWINNLSISGSKAFTVNLVNCTIYGEVKITGGTVTFSGCTFEGTDGEKPAFDCTGMTGGSVTVTDGSVSQPTQFTMDFHGSRVTAVQIDGSAFGTSSSSPLNAVDIHGCTQLNSFTFGSSIYVSTLNLSGCSNVNVSEAGGIAGQWNYWKIVGQTTQSGSAFTKKGLIMNNTGLSGETTVSNPDIRSLDVSGNSISKLTVTGGGTSNSTLTHVFAADSGITSAEIKMSPGTGAYLDLSGNCLGQSGGTAEKVVIRGPEKIGTVEGVYESEYSGGMSTGTVHADYECRQTSNNVPAPITRSSWTDDDGYENVYWHCPNCGINANAGFADAYYDDEGKLNYHKHRDCGYDDRVADQTYEVYATYYVVATRSSNLTINGKAITTGFSVTNFKRGVQETDPNGNGRYIPSGSQLNVDFSSEWNGLTEMTVNLRNNGIRYVGGYDTMQEAVKLEIRYTVRSGSEMKGTDYVARFEWGGIYENNTTYWDSWTGGLKAGSDWIKQYGLQDASFDLKYTKNEAGLSGTVTFDNYRSQSQNVLTEYVNGATMYIYPFGEKDGDTLSN